MYFPTSEVAPAPNIGNYHRIYAANKTLNLRKGADWGKADTSLTPGALQYRSETGKRCGAVDVVRVIASSFVYSGNVAPHSGKLTPPFSGGFRSIILVIPLGATVRVSTSVVFLELRYFLNGSFLAVPDHGMQ